MAELKFDILGASFTISTDEEKEYLNMIMEKFSNAVSTTKEISGISNPLNIALLTGFILCDELYKAEEQLKEGSIEINKRTTKLIYKLDEALKPFKDA